MSVLVGRSAPDFSASAVLADGSIAEIRLSEVIKNKYGLIFFYPLDFTFVCPSELISLNKRLEIFKKMNVEVIAVSIDSQFTHHAWRNTPVERGGIGPVEYTMVADVGHRICRAYGVEHPESSVALRAAFVIDRNSIVRIQIVNDLMVGRSIDELVRCIKALQFHEVSGEVCPANWEEGKPGMKPSQAGVADYLTEHANEL